MPDPGLFWSLIIGLVACLGAGYWLGAREGRAASAHATALLATLAEERKRLDRERRALRDLLVARTPAEAVELERTHDDAEREPPPRAEPAPWKSHPLVKSHTGPAIYKPERNVVQLLDMLPSQGGTVLREIQLGPDGRPRAELITPNRPA